MASNVLASKSGKLPLNFVTLETIRVEVFFEKETNVNLAIKYKTRSIVNSPQS